MRNDAANTIYIILQQISFLISNLGPKARRYSFLIPHFSFNNVQYVVIAFSISLMQINSSAV